MESQKNKNLTVTVRRMSERNPDRDVCFLKYRYFCHLGRKTSPKLKLGVASDGLARAQYGDERASSRRTRVTYGNGAGNQNRFGANRPTGLPKGIELRQMLKRSPLIRTGAAQGQSPATRRQKESVGTVTNLGTCPETVPSRGALTWRLPELRS